MESVTFLCLLIGAAAYYDGEDGYFGYEDDLNNAENARFRRNQKLSSSREKVEIEITEVPRTIYAHNVILYTRDLPNIDGANNKFRNVPILNTTTSLTMRFTEYVNATGYEELQKALSELFLGRKFNKKSFTRSYRASDSADYVLTKQSESDNLITIESAIPMVTPGKMSEEKIFTWFDKPLRTRRPYYNNLDSTENILRNSPSNPPEAINSSTTINSNTTYDSNATTVENTNQSATTTERIFDVEKFLELVANLTYDYYTNLTDRLNETLQNMSAPTCPTPTTPPDYESDLDSYRGRCYVCGLESEGIPRDANCADAFSGDFIPMIPQNPKAKGYIRTFKKHCIYKNVPNYEINITTPKSIYGRFTGGCSVRWTDITGVYTQRACRSKYRAITGKHFGSKRMAKLEMALVAQEEGCIISPSATLLPLSRGISLFARFHACVCTGNFCNKTSKQKPFPIIAAILFWTLMYLFTSMSNLPPKFRWKVF